MSLDLSPGFVNAPDGDDDNMAGAAGIKTALECKQAGTGTRNDGALEESRGVREDGGAAAVTGGAVTVSLVALF